LPIVGSSPDGAIVSQTWIAVISFISPFQLSDFDSRAAATVCLFAFAGRRLPSLCVKVTKVPTSTTQLDRFKRRIPVSLRAIPCLSFLFSF